MTRDQAREAVARLAPLAVTDKQAVDRELCGMPRDHLLVIGRLLGLRLPAVGGDKPATIGGALLRLKDAPLRP